MLSQHALQQVSRGVLSQHASLQVVSQHALQQVSRRGLLPGGGGLLRGGLLGGGGSAPGGMPGGDPPGRLLQRAVHIVVECILVK